jgi:hypothetical protein
MVYNINFYENLNDFVKSEIGFQRGRKFGILGKI